MTTPLQTSQKRFVYVGADHGGFKLKEQIKLWLSEWKVDYHDLGAHELDEADDYPDYAFAVAKRVAEMPNSSLGILACRSGGGMTIVANKVVGIRAVPVYEPKQAVHARTDDHANIISVSGDWMSLDQVKATLKAFLETEPDASERHVRRVAKITEYEGNIWTFIRQF